MKRFHTSLRCNSCSSWRASSESGWGRYCFLCQETEPRLQWFAGGHSPLQGVNDSGLVWCSSPRDEHSRLPLRRIELSVPEVCSLRSGIPSVVLREAISGPGCSLAPKTDCNQLSSLRVSEGLKKLLAFAVRRKNRLLHEARDLIDLRSKPVFNVVLNTVLAEKTFFTYRMFPRVF